MKQTWLPPLLLPPMPLRKYPWKSTADTSGAASATRTAASTIHSFLILTVLPPPGFFGQSPDRHRDEKHSAELALVLQPPPSLADHFQRRRLLGGAVRVAFVRQHLLLLSDLALVARSLAREDVDHVRIAIAVRAAAEAVLPFVPVHLAGEQILLVREALVGLHQHLVAPLGDLPGAQQLLVDRGGDGPSLAHGLIGNDDVLLDVGGLLLRLRLHAASGLGRENDHLVPLLPRRELDVRPGKALGVPALPGLDVDEGHLDGGVGRLGHLPGVLEVSVDGDRERHLVASLLHRQLRQVEGPRLVDRVGRIGVLAGTAVVSGGILEDYLLRPRGECGDRSHCREGDSETSHVRLLSVPWINPSRPRRSGRRPGTSADRGRARRPGSRR